jgi:uncharacterized protein (TIGR02266 family)
MADAGNPTLPDLRGNLRHRLILKAVGEGIVAATGNVGQDGLFLQTEEPLKVGQAMAIEISFPGLLAPMTVRGKVIWRREASQDAPPGVGLAFTDAQARDQAVLRELLARAQSAAPIAEPRPLASDQAKSLAREIAYRILVIEAADHAAMLYRHAFKRTGHPEITAEPASLLIEYAHDTTGALRIQREHPQELLLLELAMPANDGLALLQQVRGDPSFSPTKIIVVGAGGPPTLGKAAALGADIVLPKPIRMIDLINTIRALLDLRAGQAARN